MWLILNVANIFHLFLFIYLFVLLQYFLKSEAHLPPNHITLQKKKKSPSHYRNAIKSHYQCHNAKISHCPNCNANNSLS